MKALLFSLGLSASVAHAVDNGKPAPEFTLKDETGKAHSLKDFAGKIVVLEWTNPDCPFVQHHYEKKTMTKLEAKYKSKDVVWLAVDSSHNAKVSEGLAWKKANSITYPILYDTDGKVGKAYGATNTPQIFVIDKTAKLAYQGAIDDDPQDKKATPLNYADQSLSALVDGKPLVTAQTKPYGCSVKFKI